MAFIPQILSAALNGSKTAANTTNIRALSRLVRVLQFSKSFRNCSTHPGDINVVSEPEAAAIHDLLQSRANAFSGAQSKTFHDNHVQSILKRILLRKIDIEKVFPFRKEKDLSTPKYRALTEEELKEEERKAMDAAKERLLLIPEVREERKPIDVAVSEDHSISEHDKDGSNFVFTDISTGNHDLGEEKIMKDRRVVVRENATGILREANWEERDRMQFIYFPREFQDSRVKPFLQDNYLHLSLQSNRHEYLLDAICIQCEADHPDYIRVHHRVYEDMLTHEKKFDILQSTRHYPAFLHYATLNKKSGLLVVFFLRNDRFLDAVDLVQLHNKIHHENYEDVDTSKSEAEQLESFRNLIENYLLEMNMESDIPHLSNCLQRLENQNS